MHVTSDASGLACASGCTSRARHLATCEHQDDGTCTGCLPRIATVGYVCTGCTGRYVRAISEAPDLIAHVRLHLDPAFRGLPAEDGSDGQGKAKGKGQGKHTPAPLALDVVDAADELYSELASWVRVTCDELDLTMPTIHAWRPEGAAGQVAGLKPESVDDSATMARLLLRHAERIFEQPWVTVLIAEVGKLVHRVDRTWPRVERPVYLPTPCPECDMISLVRYVPAWPGGPTTIRCNRPACGKIIQEDLYEFYALVVIAERQNSDQGDDQNNPASAA